ncbi:hypothetical protein ACFLUG_03945 [Chloroflexota bacterium]
MRRPVSVILFITGLFTLVTGVWNFFPPVNATFSPGHAIGASIFGALSIIHVWLNWKPILNYSKSLGWWWILVALGLIASIVVGIIPLLRKGF